MLKNFTKKTRFRWIALQSYTEERFCSFLLPLRNAMSSVLDFREGLNGCNKASLPLISSKKLLKMAIDLKQDIILRRMFPRLILVFAFFASCTFSSQNSLRDGLINQGPQPISESNPYLTANAFLGREAELSPLLLGFLECRGTPDLIEVTKRFLSPFSIRCIYLDSDESYFIEGESPDWLIRGPENISEHDIPDFHQFPRTSGKAPLVSKKNSLLLSPNKPSISKEICLGKRPVKTVVKPESHTQISKVPSAAAIPKEPANSSTAVVPKEVSSGDIIHRVNHAGETLDIIASWYTGSAENAGRIARINNLQISALLHLGQSIRIPYYLIQRTTPLPEMQVEVLTPTPE